MSDITHTAFRNGDILFCSGKSLISQQIKDFTNSKYSHVGLIFNFQIGSHTEPFVIEALPEGITALPLNQYFTNYKRTKKPYHGSLFVGRMKANLSFYESRQIFRYANDCIGMPYDKASIIKIAVNRVFGVSLRDSDSHRLICSELVGSAYRFAGIKLPLDRHGYYTPGSISTSQDLEIELIKT